MIEYFFVTLVLATVIVLLLIAQKTDGGVRFTLNMLSLYWGASYVLRPIIFLYARDNNVNNKIFDIRIGNSTDEFVSILQKIVIGNVIFCFVTLVILKSSKVKNNNVTTTSEPMLDSKLLKISLLVGILSVLMEMTGLRNPISKSLESLVAFSLCAFLWNRKRYILTRTNEFLVIGAGFVTILYISADSGHFKGLILTPIVVFIYRLKIWKNRKHLVLKIGAFLFIVLSFIPFFSFLQNQKLGSDTTKILLNNSNEFPWFLSPLLNIAVRFDQFARISDAHFAGPGVLGGWREWMNSIARSLQWNPTSGRDGSTFGQLWNKQVTSLSVPGAQFSPVSLAQGMIGEGWIWKGLISLVVACSVMAFIFNGVGRLLDGNYVRASASFALIGNGTIFESGVVQEFTSVSAAIKNLLFILVVRAFLRIKTNRP